MFRNVSGSILNGVITYTFFRSKQQFDEWWEVEEQNGWRQVVEKGVSRERANILCSTPEAILAQADAIFSVFERS